MTAPAHQDNTAQTAKGVHLIPADAAIKRLCFDDATQSLRPNLVLVDRQGSVVFEINELGLKGAARDPARKLAVVWGDSVVFGVRWSWPCLIDDLAPGYQFLNGGIEADPYGNILRRAAAFNREHEVALNILLPGWHPMTGLPDLPVRQDRPATLLARIAAAFPGLRRPPPALASPAGHPAPPPPSNPGLHDDLLAFLEGTPNTVLVTMPTALNRNIVECDLSASFTNSGRDAVFRFAGDFPYSLAAQRYLFAHITERNRVVREAAEATGKRLIDLAAEFDTENLADFRADFFDVLHLRPSAYKKAAAAIYAGIKDLL